MAIRNKQQKRKKVTGVGEVVEKLESLCTISGNISVVAAVENSTAGKQPKCPLMDQ